jgi:FAD:protein FMN transferase
LNPGRPTAPLLRLVLLLCLLSSWTGCRTGSTPAVRREFTATRMGMPWRIVLYAPSDREAEEAADAAWNRITELNRILSDYEPDSELSRLSRSSGSGTDVPVSEDLFRVLERAEQVSRAGDGSFDITVGPLVDVWKRARRQRALPDASRIAAARDACGWTNVVLGRDAQGRRTARLLRPGMRLDPGGIAKGYAIGEATKVLRSRGITRSLVSGGGDLYAASTPPGESGWVVTVGLLDLTNAPPGRQVRLRDQALVTSGDLFQRVEIGGVRYSHIVDPRTGQALTDHSQVTLVGRDPMTLDALSKVLSVLGPTRADALCRRFDIDALLFRAPDGRLSVHETPGWRRNETASRSGTP